MAVNDINYSQNSILDLSGDTVNPEVLEVGYTAHDASGASITGISTAVYYGKVQNLTEQQKAQARDNIDALSTNDTINNSLKLGDKFPERFIPSENLLDNSYWERPADIVNQRNIIGSVGAGASTANKKYFIDRWKVNSPIDVNMTDGGLQFVNTRSDDKRIGVYQALHDQNLHGKILTFAICLNDGTIYTASGVVPSTETTANKVYIGSSNEHYISVYNDGGNPAVIIAIGVATSLTIRWAALYEGSYTSDTIPPYIPKGFAVELAECRRYYRRFHGSQTHLAVMSGFVSSGSTVIIFTLPEFIEMVEQPTVIANCSLQIRGLLGYADEGSSSLGTTLTDGVYTLFYNNGSGCMMQVKKSDGTAFTNVTNNTPITIYFLKGSLLEFEVITI